jgi:replicative DNA helicase
MINSLEAEQAVVGSMLIDGGCISSVKSIITPDDIQFASYKDIINAMYEMHSAGEPIDPITVLEKMKQTGTRNEYTAALILEIVNITPTSANAAEYAQIVKMQSMSRQIKDLGTYLYESDEPDPLVTLTEAHRRLDGIGQGIQASVVSSLTACTNFLDYRCVLDKKADSVFVKTGYAKLDELLGGGLLNEGLYIIGARPGMGKDQPLYSKILTPAGWTTMREISVGDSVIGSNGTSYKVTGVYPQGLRDVYGVQFSDGTYTECGEQHLWETRTRLERRYGKPSIKTTKEIMGSITTNADQRLNHSVRYVEPVCFSDKELPLAPYLLGALLGDGGLSQPTVLFTNPESDIIDRLRTLIPKGDELQQKDVINYSIRKQQHSNDRSETRKILDDMGFMGKLSYQKHIPKEYLYSGINDRIELLRGLIDTDGTVVRGNCIEYSTTAPNLANDVKELVQSLGGRCTITSRMGRYRKEGKTINTRTNYRLNLSFTNNVVPVSSKKHLAKYSAAQRKLDKFIERIDYVGKMETQCIMVDSPDHLYVTDDYILTHNSTFALAIADNVAGRNEPTQFTTLEMSEKQLMAKRVARLSLIASNVVLMGMLSPDEYKKVTGALAALSERPLYINRKNSATVAEIGAMASGIKGLRLIVIDYFGLIKPSSDRKSRVEETTITSGELKALARRLNIPILCLAQLNRMNEQRGNKRPQLSDLRETGALEQDADGVIFLHREDYYSDNKGDSSGAKQLEVILAKNRHGDTGKLTMAFYPATSKITS